MIHLLAHYGVWAAIAFLLGALVAFACRARPGEQARLLRRSDYPLALWACLAIAVAQVTLGRISLYFDGALLLLIASAAGLAAVAALWGPLSRDSIAWPLGAAALALTCVVANVEAVAGIESDLRHRLGSLLAREGGDPLNFEVSGRDVFVPSNTPGRAAFADRLALTDGVRIVYSIDALSRPAAARRERALAENAARAASGRAALAEWEPRQAIPTERRSVADFQARNGEAVARVPAQPAPPAPLAWLPPRDPTLPQAAEKKAEPTPERVSISPCRAEIAALATSQKILFPEASAALGAASQRLLSRLAALLKQCPQAELEIRGYTDSRGRAETNRRLSLRRAHAVADYLGRAGVARDRLVSAGSEPPGAARDEPLARAEDRRVEFAVK